MSDTAGPASHYDEFGLFHENIAEFGLDVAIPTVVRGDVELDAGRSISALTWGEPGAAEVVFVHGGAQNAHTWDTVALALGRPALAVDLPGHGHSSWRSDGAYSPANLADAKAIAAQLREGGEAGLPGLRAIGLELPARGGVAQVSMNIEDHRSLPLADVVAAVNERAAVGEAELVGLAPRAAFDGWPDQLICRNRVTLEDALGF